MNHSIIFILILTTMTAFSCGKQSDGVTYRVAIPDDFHLVPALANDDKWFSSLVGNLAKRANEPRLNYSVWRMTNIPCSVDGRDIAKAVFARDENDNRFLVWTPECAVYHGGRPWLISWDHGMAYETNPAATSFYRSPSGRYIIAISPSHYGATYSKGQLAPRFQPLQQGTSRSSEFKVGGVAWRSILEVSERGLRSAEWHPLESGRTEQVEADQPPARSELKSE